MAISSIVPIVIPVVAVIVINCLVVVSKIRRHHIKAVNKAAA